MENVLSSSGDYIARCGGSGLRDMNGEFVKNYTVMQAA